VSGFDAAWRTYLCALQGHVLRFVSVSTTAQVYGPAQCSRCGAYFNAASRDLSPMGGGPR
jgi:hypothetical protein